jgi:hypothetical protein
MPVFAFQSFAYGNTQKESGSGSEQTSVSFSVEEVRSNQRSCSTRPVFLLFLPAAIETEASQRREFVKARVAEMSC